MLRSLLDPSPRILLRSIAVLMLAAQAVIHLDLWRQGYRQIPTIGMLFLVGVLAAGTLALAVAVIPNRWVLAAAAAVSVGQVLALVLTRVTGLFGFMTAGSLSPSELSAVAAELLAAAAIGALVAVRRVDPARPVRVSQPARRR